jgi:hypothetical protein
MIVLSPTSGPTSAYAAPFDVRLQLEGKDVFDRSSAFTRIAPATGLAANAGISDTWSIPFVSVGASAMGGGIVGGHASGFARPGEIGAAAVVEGSSFGAGQASGFILARAEASYESAVIFDSTDPAETMVKEGKLPLLFDGGFFLDATYGHTFPCGPGQPGLTHAEAVVQVRGIRQGSIPLGEGDARLSRTVTGDCPPSDLVFGGGTSGVLSGYTGTAGPVFIVLTFENVPVDVPVPFTLYLKAEAFGTLSHAGGGFAGIMDASVHFEHTLSFRPASLGTVFDLPPGFTANSTDGAIVDNFWIRESTTSVPEAASGWLIVAGVLALAWRYAGRPRQAQSAIWRGPERED